MINDDNNIVDTVVNIAVLPENKAKALEMLLSNVPVKDVATELGVHRGTIYYWMQSSEFKEHLDKRTELVLDNLYNMSIDVLREQLLSDNIYAQQWAVNTIAKLKGKNDVNVNVTQKPTSVAELLAMTRKV